MVTHQLQVERRTGKVRRPETDVLPLCHATNPGSVGQRAVKRVCVSTCTEWTLGAVLYEDEVAAINDCSAVAPVLGQIRSSSGVNLRAVSTTTRSQRTLALAALAYALLRTRLGVAD